MPCCGLGLGICEKGWLQTTDAHKGISQSGVTLSFSSKKMRIIGTPKRDT